MIITFCNYKGGVGKTTLTLLLAFAFEQSGKTVGIIDNDPQGTATKTIKLLQAKNKTKIQITKDPKEFDIVLVDTAPQLDKKLAGSVAIANKIVLVVSPSPATLWSSKETSDYIQSHIKAKTQPRLLFNAVKPNTLLAKLIDETTKQIGMKRYQNIIYDSVAYQTLTLRGWHSLSAKQKQQIQQLAIEIITS